MDRIKGRDGSLDELENKKEQAAVRFNPFITAHEAEGEGVHEVSSGNFIMPVKVFFEYEHFAISGIENSTQVGGIISGRILNNVIKIDHIDLDEKLRRSGLSVELLRDLEEKLKDRGVDNFYASFYTIGTVEFFLKNGYEIISPNNINLSDEEKKKLFMKSKDFDQRVKSEADFQDLKTVEGIKFGKILLKKV